MRLLHTADWHLGRQLYGHSLIEDQAHALDELMRLVRDARPDAVLIAGDIFDRAVPPTEAVELLDEILARLVLELRTPTLLIAGNHDSAVRLGFASRLLRGSGLVVVGSCVSHEPLVIEDEHGPVEIHGVAYGEPASVRAIFGGSLHDHELALRAQIGGLVCDPRRRCVLVAHAFVADGIGCESERPLSVGGAGTVPTGLFENFCYTALGHLHGPQAFAGGRVRYAGSLLKYSRSEIGHAKSVSLVELDADGDCRVEAIGLDLRRDVRVLTGTLRALLEGQRTEDYVVAVLEDRAALLEPFARLREIYPNLLTIERSVFDPAEAALAAARDTLQRDVPELFADFVAAVTGSGLDDDEADTFRELYAAWRAEQQNA